MNSDLSHETDVLLVEAEFDYRRAQYRVTEEVHREIRKRELRLLTEHQEEQERNSCGNKTKKKPMRVRDTKGEIVPPERQNQHLTETAQTLLVVSREGDEETGAPSIMLERKQTGISVQVDEIIAKLGNISKSTGCKLDDISAGVLLHLGNRGVLYNTELRNRMFSDQEGTPGDWNEGKVTLIDKANSMKGNFSTYRPITITPVSYRLFTRIFAERILEWMEDKCCLSEMQNGFRKGRRRDDC